MKTLRVRIVKAYGRTVVYPLCETSRLFAELLEQITLTENDCDLIKKIGFEFLIESEEVKL